VQSFARRLVAWMHLTTRKQLFTDPYHNFHYSRGNFFLRQSQDDSFLRTPPMNRLWSSLIGLGHRQVEPTMKPRKRRSRQQLALGIPPTDGSGETSKRPLVEVLAASGRPLRLPELFARAGYNRDSPEEVELFYLALREALGRLVVVGRSRAENAPVELAHHAN
jgi:hypothetical protein